MVDFRRWIIAAAVLALFAGLAGAQVPGGGGTGPLQCTASVAVPPTLRAEGLTELIGDIVLTCTGGQAQVAGQPIPTANITVSLGTQVTSRLLGNNGGNANSSEALLLIDEPGATLPAVVAGFGPAAPQTLCNDAPAAGMVGAGPGGCVEYAKNVPLNGGTLQVMSSSSTAILTAPNVFQGVVNANQVSFPGIPVLAPVSAGITRVFRMTNIRANATALGTGLAGTVALVASISISGSTSLPINNPTLTAGFIQSGLSTAVRNNNNTGALSSSGASYNQCSSQSLTAQAGGVAILQYTENFGTAFKTRVAARPLATADSAVNNALSYNGQAGPGTAVQNIPGYIYNSESGFVTSALPTQNTVSGGVNTFTTTAGLADYGTRLRAVFSNVPAGVSLYVSVTNLATNTQSANTIAPAATATTSYAQLVSGETTPDGNGTPPFLASTTGTNTPSGSTTPNTALWQVPLTSGSGEAVWEIINTNPALNETFQFGVWITYTANVINNLPALGTATVNMSYAPISTSASPSGNPIPRFIDNSGAGNKLLVITACQTLLLFPYVTNMGGFDTGLAISNTTQDPVGTAGQSGTCTLNWYDGSGKFPVTNLKVTDFTNANTTTGNAGTTWVGLTSNLAANFTGYMFALCQFQYAHGFAFISDLGARNLAMGYLALVVNNGTASARGPASETLGN